MAADARPYKSKEQDGNGNEIILRDQQLVEQSSQTTMASTEYFEIVDVDGRMAKIPKDNMIGVVREALGSLLNGLADQTTVAKFLTLNGNTLGASAATTAASVLGVKNIGSYTLAADQVINIEKEIGIYQIYISSAGHSFCALVGSGSNMTMMGQTVNNSSVGSKVSGKISLYYEDGNLKLYNGFNAEARIRVMCYWI